MTAVPCAPLPTVICDVPGTTSFASTGMSTGVSSLVTAVSSRRLGGTLTRRKNTSSGTKLDQPAVRQRGHRLGAVKRLRELIPRGDLVEAELAAQRVAVRRIALTVDAVAVAVLAVRRPRHREAAVGERRHGG